jgi:hypothetical protein
MNIADGGFMGYFVGASSYEILSITDNRMKVRVIQNEIRFLVSYFYDNTSCIICSSTDYTVLKFSDEFNVDGAPDAINGAMI